VGEPLSLTVRLGDDGVPEPRAVRGTKDPRIDVDASGRPLFGAGRFGRRTALGLRVAWLHWRGPGTVTFAPWHMAGIDDRMPGWAPPNCLLTEEPAQRPPSIHPAPTWCGQWQTTAIWRFRSTSRSQSTSRVDADGVSSALQTNQRGARDTLVLRIIHLVLRGMVGASFGSALPLLGAGPRRRGVLGDAASQLEPHNRGDVRPGEPVVAGTGVGVESAGDVHRQVQRQIG
jgi:hypothetical protein